MEDYGLPKPDHKLGRGAPDGLVGPAHADRPRARDGQAEHRAASRATGAVRRRLGRAEVDTDRVVHGLQDHVPVPRPEAIVGTGGNHVPLYRRVVHPERPGLYFIGLIQPLGAIMPIAERQSEWIADLLEGKAALPGRATHARGDRARGRPRCAKRYVASTRHTIQVDFHPYMRLLRARAQAQPRRAAPAAGRPARAAAAPVAPDGGCRRRHGRRARLRARDRAPARRARVHRAGHRHRRRGGRRRPPRPSAASRCSSTCATPRRTARAARAAAERGPLEVWVNNAGVLRTRKAWEHPDDEVRLLVDVNLLGVIWGSRAAVDAMRERGRPEHARDQHRRRCPRCAPVPGLAVYAATKHARARLHQPRSRATCWPPASRSRCTRSAPTAPTPR